MPLPRAKLGGMRKGKVKGAGRSMRPVSSKPAVTPCDGSLAGLPEWARLVCSTESKAQIIPASSLLVPQLPSTGGGSRGGLLKVVDAAALLNVSTKTIRRLIQRGELRAVRIGCAIRIQPEDIERLIKE